MAASERFPRRQVLLCSGATRKWGHPTRHLPPLPACSWATSNASQGTEGGPLARFAIQEVIDHQVVRAIWTDERLTCDRLLGARARLLVYLERRVP